MLFKTPFKTAAELKITDHERDALVEVLRRLECDEITDFHMGSWCTCLCGQAFKINGAFRSYFQWGHPLNGRNAAAMSPQVERLFGQGISRALLPSPAQAAINLRDFLTTGQV